MKKSTIILLFISIVTVFNENYSVGQSTFSNVLYFGDGKNDVGWLGINNGYLEFGGNIGKSAQPFFNYLKEEMIDPYMKDYCEKERKNEKH